MGDRGEVLLGEAGKAMTLALFLEKSPAEGVPVESNSRGRPVNLVRLELEGEETVYVSVTSDDWDVILEDGGEGMFDSDAFFFCCSRSLTC